MKCVLLVMIWLFSPGLCKRHGNEGNPLEGRPEGPPKWVKSMDKLVIPVSSGTNADLKCRARGNPTPNITWLRNGVEFTHRGGQPIRSNRAVLKLTKVSLLDKANYTCIVSNSQGSLTWTYQLHVVAREPKTPPIFKTEPKNTTLFVGETARFECRVISSTEMPHIQWIKHYQINGSYYDDKNHPLFVRLDGNRGIIPNSGGLPDPSILLVPNVTYNDSGWYTCVASNSYGQIQYSAWLDIREPTSEPYIYNRSQALPVVDHGRTLILIGCGVGAMIVIIIVMNVFIYRYWRSKKKVTINAPLQQMNAIYGPPHGPNVSPYSIPIDPQCEIPRENIDLLELVGEGAFGQVLKGRVTGLYGKTEPSIVAVKMLKADATEVDWLDLLQEMRVMKTIGHHINILNLIGCATQNGPLYVIMEYAPYGNLRDFLRFQRPVDSGYEKPLSRKCLNLRPLTYKDLVSFAYQVARGIEYLHTKKVIHRDLAARNVLVAEEYIIKIADFGLTRKLSETEYYRKTTNGRLPVKWMSPEALYDRRFSAKADVWSFGILLWEIFTFGANPYPSVPNEQLYRLLQDGHRMEPPPFGSLEIYTMMLRTWRWMPKQRPSFADLVHMLDNILAENVDTEYLTLKTPDSSGRSPLASDSQYSSSSSVISSISSQVVKPGTQLEVELPPTMPYELNNNEEDTPLDSGNGIIHYKMLRAIPPSSNELGYDTDRLLQYDTDQDCNRCSECRHQHSDYSIPQHSEYSIPQHSDYSIPQYSDYSLPQHSDYSIPRPGPLRVVVASIPCQTSSTPCQNSQTEQLLTTVTMDSGEDTDTEHHMPIRMTSF